MTLKDKMNYIRRILKRYNDFMGYGSSLPPSLPKDNIFLLETTVFHGLSLPIGG